VNVQARHSCINIFVGSGPRKYYDKIQKWNSARKKANKIALVFGNMDNVSVAESVDIYKLPYQCTLAMHGGTHL
jgi:hypothetical protein